MIVPPRRPPTLPNKTTFALARDKRIIPETEIVLNYF